MLEWVWDKQLGESLERRVMTEFPQTSFWPGTGGQLIVLGFEVVMGFFVALAIHEAAHVLVGVWVGFSFNSLRIGRLQFDRPFRISIYRGRGTGASGWASMFPVKKDALALRAMAMTSAGPAANLLAGFIVFLLPFSKGFLSLSFALWSLLLGFLSLLPYRSRAMFSDGMRILMLLRSRERGERWVAILKLLAELKEGVSPEDLSADFLAKAIAIRDNSPDTVTSYALAYEVAYFQHDDAKTAEYLETCLHYSPYTAPIMRQALMSDAGVFQGRKQKRVNLAEEWLAAMPGKTEIPWLGANVEAAILEAKGNITGALRKLDAVEKLVLASPNQAQREIAHRSLLRWRSELLAQVTATIEAEKPGPKN